jgi:hypothetical protein
MTSRFLEQFDHLIADWGSLMRRTFVKRNQRAPDLFDVISQIVGEAIDMLLEFSRLVRLPEIKPPDDARWGSRRVELMYQLTVASSCFRKFDCASTSILEKRLGTYPIVEKLLKLHATLWPSDSSEPNIVDASILAHCLFHGGLAASIDLAAALRTLAVDSVVFNRFLEQLSLQNRNEHMLRDHELNLQSGLNSKQSIVRLRRRYRDRFGRKRRDLPSTRAIELALAAAKKQRNHEGPSVSALLTSDHSQSWSSPPPQAPSPPPSTRRP